MTMKIFGVLALSTVCVLGCGDKGIVTQPPPVRTPVPDALSMEVALSPLDLPAGAKHAARATIVVRELLGKSVTLRVVDASTSYVDETHIPVSGFAPLLVGPNQTVSFDVTLTWADDVMCGYGLDVAVTYASDDGGLHEVMDNVPCSEWLPLF